VSLLFTPAAAASGHVAHVLDLMARADSATHGMDAAFILIAAL
jgi:hypothetical protein